MIIFAYLTLDIYKLNWLLKINYPSLFIIFMILVPKNKNFLIIHYHTTFRFHYKYFINNIDLYI